jgi:serpin B
LRDWLRRIDTSPSAKVIVKLPRFSIRQTMADVVEQLRAMGLNAPFDTATADFSGMIGAPTPRVLIGTILHAATIDVAEDGVEATAATVMAGATAAPQHEPPPEFRADRPFLYLIRDQATGLILFIGRYDGDVPAA